MKPSFYLIAITTVFIISTAKAQTPGGINYQGFARGQYLTAIVADSIYLRFTIREKTANGAVVYTETRKTFTDSSGVFHVVIGSGGAMVQSTDIKKVAWSDTTKKFMQVEMKLFEPGSLPDYINMGTTQMLSVPFSFYSDISEGSGSYFFSATIPPGYFQSVPSGSIYSVSVPRVLINEGNAYDSVTSIFTAPDTGMYHFDITAAHLLDENSVANINAAWLEDAQVALSVNGNFVKLLHEEFHSNNPSVPGSAVDRGVSYFNTPVTLKLNKNDQVSIKLRVTYTNFNNYRMGYSFDGLDPRLHAEFSGYKIR